MTPGVSNVICCSPVMTVFLDGLEILCVGVLVGIFEQGALEGLLRVPGLRPGLQVLLDGLGDTFVMRSHNLSSVIPIDLRQHRYDRRFPISIKVVSRHRKHLKKLTQLDINFLLAGSIKKQFQHYTEHALTNQTS